MLYQGFGQATSIPGVEDGINYIKSKIGLFLQLPSRISKSQDKANELMKVARSKRNTKQAARVLGVQTALRVLKDQYVKVEAKVNQVLADLKAAGFGLFPLILAGAVVTAAGYVAVLFKSVQYQERVLEDVEKKLLTPGEARAFLGGPFGLTPIMLIGIAGLTFAGWWFWRGKKK